MENLLIEWWKKCVQGGKKSENANRVDSFIWHLRVLNKYQINGEDLVNFFGLLRKHELYKLKLKTYRRRKAQKDIQESYEKFRKQSNFSP